MLPCHLLPLLYGFYLNKLPFELETSQRFLLQNFLLFLFLKENPLKSLDKRDEAHASWQHIGLLGKRRHQYELEESSVDSLLLEDDGADLFRGGDTKYNLRHRT